jgi:hypothetical protein
MNYILMFGAILAFQSHSFGQDIIVTIYGKGKSTVETDDVNGKTRTIFCPISAQQVCASIIIKDLPGETPGAYPGRIVQVTTPTGEVRGRLHLASPLSNRRGIRSVRGTDLFITQ